MGTYLKIWPFLGDKFRGITMCKNFYQLLLRVSTCLVNLMSIQYPRVVGIPLNCGRKKESETDGGNSSKL